MANEAPDEEDGIIPAYAGSTFDSEFLCGPGTDHPRIRGEHVSAVLWIFAGIGSSPHTRGALFQAWPRRQPGGIIPAYAGSTPTRPGRIFC